MPDSSDGADAVPPGAVPAGHPATPVHAAKVDLRAELLRRRRALPAARRTAAADRVQETLTDLVRRLRPATMTGYVPVGTEPGGGDLPDALRAVLAPAGVLLLPVLRPDLDLDWAAYPGPGGLPAPPTASPLAPPPAPASAPPLAAAGRGMREPTGPRLGPAAIADADLVVVPAVAVDRRGVRLGRGGGSYDRALARVGAGVPIVALLHDGELVEAVPAEPHDRPVTAVITPAGGFQRITGPPEARA